MTTKEQLPDVIDISPVSVYLTGEKAIVMTSSTTPTLYSSAQLPVEIDATIPKYVPWGDDNKLPYDIAQKVALNPFMSQNMLFNITAGYGDGVMAVKRIIENGKVRFEPYVGNAEIRAFFEENRLDNYLLEQLTDLNFFYNVFPEVIFNGENGAKRKIVQLTSKEAMFSRWSEMAVKGDEKGRITKHFYYADWHKQRPQKDDLVVTDVLDRTSPVAHLRKMMKEDEGKQVKARRNRFIIPVNMPTPGRPYYSKPYWYALIEGGVYDFSQKIMPFKNAMMDNQANVKYVVELGPNYFEEIFKRERIMDEKAKTARIKKEYGDINNFLKGVKNTNKSIITHQKLDPKGSPYPMITIKVIDNKTIGGELIADNEEVANIMGYGMGVHPSLVGAAPGKTKSINGTEARELFILKQATLKPIRDLLLYPFYLIKAINAWPEDCFFTVPNIQLTTLDNDKTGSTTVIPQNP